MGRLQTTGVVVAFTALSLAAGEQALAESLSDTIEQFLSDADQTIEDTKIWKFHLRPSLKESLIWTDNVFLNDKGEDPLRLTSQLGPGGTTIPMSENRRRALEQQLLPDSAELDREDDFILQSQLTLDFELPVNAEMSESYSKAFDSDRLTILSVEAKNQEYFDLNELDNTGINIKTDLFAFLSDLFTFDEGNRITVRTRAQWSKITDPLDAQFRFLRQDGVSTTATTRDFERQEFDGAVEVGYIGGRFDAKTSYEYYDLSFKDSEFDQASHTRQTGNLEFGTEVPGMADKRAYIRTAFSSYHFGRADVLNAQGNKVSETQALNDAYQLDTLIGIEGDVFSHKLNGRAEIGYTSWDPDSSGAIADNNSYNGVIGAFRLAYRPWEERKTFFQAQYRHYLGYSSISNYNANHEVTVSAVNEFIPERLDADASATFVRTVPSDGPHRSLWELGLGATYHLYEQMDLTFRYLTRYQESTDEIIVNSAFSSGGRTYAYTLHSDGDFWQNIFEVGVNIRF